MVLLGGGSGKNYRNRTEALEDNRANPVTAAVGAHLVVYELQGGQATIMAQGVKISCDGGVLVLGLRPSDYEYAGGVPILGTSRQEDVEPGDKTEQRVRLSGRHVANGTAYRAWLQRRSGGR